MPSLRLITSFVTGLVATSLPIVAHAQGAGTSGNPPPAYRPGLGDLMTMTVQPRHLKLGLAGQERNWAFAAYALHELEESFERVARVWPKWHDIAIGETSWPRPRSRWRQCHRRSRPTTPRSSPTLTVGSPPPATPAIKARMSA